MSKIESHSRTDFEDYLTETKNTICGRRPISLLMAVIELSQAKGAKLETKFVKYDQSSAVTSPEDSSVSYGSSYTVL
jgi:MEMO1 family protein